VTLHTHSDRLERWLGAAHVEQLSRAMRDWPGPAIALHGVPGAVYAAKGGDFVGEIRAGQEVCAADRAAMRLKQLRREQLARAGRYRRQLGAFGSLSALIAAATGGKKQELFFNKAGVASNAVGNCIDLWTLGNQPAAGAAGGAAPGGTSPTNATAGALPYANPANANTGHFTTGYALGTVAPNTLLLYDRLLAVAKTMNSTATEAVSGTFARYQNASATASDYIGGNFCFPSVPTTVLAATAHNWTVCQYTNQAAATGKSFPSIAGVSACVKNGIDLAANNWFLPFAAGDVGVKALTQMQCSALVATGTVDFVVGHPIAFMPCLTAYLVCLIDGINTAFNLTFIYDNACLALLEMPKAATTATTYTGQVTAVAE
jgi:hypothetical protein